MTNESITILLPQFNHMCEELEELRAYKRNAEQQKEKTGHWLDEANRIDAQYGRHLYRCSECGRYAEYFAGGTGVWWDICKPNYCPNCGAKMEVENDS